MIRRLAPSVLNADLAQLAYQVRLVEEPNLRSVHGDAYGRYQTTAGRFLPRVGIDRS